MRLFRVAVFAIVLAVAASGSAAAEGRIVVSGDVWWTADGRFQQPAGSRDFALNIARFFVGDRVGNFLVRPENSLPWLNGTELRNTMTGAGHLWTNYADVPGFTFDLATLLRYDAVFVTRIYPGGQMSIPASVLADYVRAGGNVFVGLGMGLDNDTGANEAADWNPFLNAFGMNIPPLYNGIQGDIPIVSSHPLMNGVVALYQNNGSTIALTGSDPGAVIVASYQGAGLYAAWERPPYSFSGFLKPTKNLPALNKDRAGRQVSLAFSLNGDHGLNILASGSPVSVSIPCEPVGDVPVVNESTAPGVLVYDARKDTYRYQWDTDPAWAGTCRQFVLELDDRSVHRANFQFAR